jgi:23S rRNA (cytidine1920-2'-O)/16S rRNA (cytidine1409-2'-O)-methyltransferase
MRADKYFSEKFGSRTKAAAAIEKGLILVNGKTIKAKTEILENDEILFIQPEEEFVSNGGYKLAKGLQTFSYSCENKIFVDIGASTGGFSDCLLQNGAQKVYAVDVGESLLHDKIKNNPRIVVFDNRNARYLEKEDFADEIDCVVTDVSFISLRLIFPVIAEILETDGIAFVLIKPQFECENQHIGKSGIVTPSAHAKIVEKVLGYMTENGLHAKGIVNAPIRKGKNVEYILFLQKTPYFAKNASEIVEEVKRLVKQNSLDLLE